MEIQIREELGQVGNGRLRALEAGLGRLLGRSVPKTNGASAQAFEGFRPPCNISETDDGYLVEVELPATDKKDIRVTMAGGTLAIQGERHRRPEANNVRSLLAECKTGVFHREFDLPTDAAPASAEASFTNGMLVFMISKTARNDQPPEREIQIA